MIDEHDRSGGGHAEAQDLPCAVEHSTNSSMTLLAAIDSRASAVRLTTPAPTREQLERILLSGVRVPDHGRLAPARFFVLQEQGRARLAAALGAALERRHPAASAEQIAAERAKASRAPVVIVVAARITREHRVPALEQLASVAAGVQNMFLTAHALGLGVMWKTGSAAYDPQVKLDLGLLAEDEIVAFLYLGTIARPGVCRQIPLDAAVVWD